MGSQQETLGRKLSVEALGAGSALPNISVFSPRPGIARPGCKTDLAYVSFRCRSLYLPGSAERSGGTSPTAASGGEREGEEWQQQGAQSGRFTARFARPCCNRSAEREAMPCDDHPESRSAPSNAWKHHLCSPRLKRTRQKTTLSRRHRLARPRPRPNPPKAGFGHKAVSFPPLRRRLCLRPRAALRRLAPTRACGRSLCAIQRKVGAASPRRKAAHLPPRPVGAELPAYQPAGRVTPSTPEI